MRKHINCEFMRTLKKYMNVWPAQIIPFIANLLMFYFPSQNRTNQNQMHAFLSRFLGVSEMLNYY